MFGKIWKASLAGGAALLMALPASATTLEKMGFGEMVSDASACIIADVATVTSERRNGQMVTLTTFNVQKAAFGQVGSQVTVVTPGGSGTMGRLQISEVVAGSPRFLSAQESLMLLAPSENTNEYVIVGLNQGLFSVTDGPGGVNMVALPIEVGGKVTLDDAVEIIRDQRNNPSTPEIE